MKTRTFFFFFSLCMLIMINMSCTPTKNTTNYTSQHIHTNTTAEENLLRADPRFITWLEKSALYRNAPHLLSIVSGTSLSWRSSSLLPDKNNILSHSPTWFYANPWKIKAKDITHVGEFLNAKTPEYLKSIGINALFFSPTASFSLNQELAYKEGNIHHFEVNNDDNTQIWFYNKPEYAIVGFGIDTTIASTEQYQRLENTHMLIGGSMLEPALGIGSDFLLALRAVREYSGLFMMTELPQELWKDIPNSSTKNTFAYTVLDEAQTEFLSQYGLIPPYFSRDLLLSSFENEATYSYKNGSRDKDNSDETYDRNNENNNENSTNSANNSSTDALLQSDTSNQKSTPEFRQESGFCVTNPIRGVDSAERRWIYRYAQNPLRPLLNLADPNLNAHKLFSASIIQQVGLLHQPLIGVSIGDLWGQEVSSFSKEKAKRVLSELFTLKENSLTSLKNQDTSTMNIKQLQENMRSFAEPALFTLAMLNKTIHNYGAWSLVEDAFPIEYIPLLLEENADFVADTIIMPALEEAFLVGNTNPLKNATKYALHLGIDFQSLWHASQDRYQKTMFQDYFKYPTSMSMATHLAKIDTNEAKFLEKYTLANTNIAQSKDTKARLQDLAKLNTLEPNPVRSTNLIKKLQTAHNIQFSFLMFQSLLPGISFISAYDLQGIVPKNPHTSALLSMPENLHTLSTQTNLPSFPLSKKYFNQSEQSIMLHPFLENQAKDTQSLLHKLGPIYTYKQKEEIAQARVMGILETKDSLFGLLLQAPSNKYFALLINVTNKNQRVNVKIITTQNTNIHLQTIQQKQRFTRANDAFTPLSRSIQNNTLSFPISAYECKLFELK